MTTRIETFRDHCRRMATAQHRPECPSLTAREPWWDPWEEIDGNPLNGLRWRGPKPKWEPPKCDGCVSDADRELFARLAGEAEAYIQGELMPSRVVGSSEGLKGAQAATSGLVGACEGQSSVSSESGGA